MAPKNVHFAKDLEAAARLTELEKRVLSQALREQEEEESDDVPPLVEEDDEDYDEDSRYGPRVHDRGALNAGEDEDEDAEGEEGEYDDYAEEEEDEALFVLSAKLDDVIQALVTADGVPVADVLQDIAHSLSKLVKIVHALSKKP